MDLMRYTRKNTDKNPSVLLEQMIGKIAADLRQQCTVAHCQIK
jgi:hypothetical protein